MEKFTVRLETHDGDTWELNGERGVWLTEDGLDVTVSRSVQGQKYAGAPGEFLGPGAVDYAAAAGTLRFIVDMDDPVECGRVWQEFLAVWESGEEQRLVVRAGDGSERYIPVVLGDGGVAAPPRSPDWGRLLHLEVPVKSFRGLWWERGSTSTNKVTLRNNGVVNIWPKIVWKGEGGTVKLPSGASFKLPAVPGLRTVHLDPFESGVVTTATGKVDPETWAMVREAVLFESVPPGEARSYTAPAGAHFEWESGRLSPWR